MAQAVNYFDDLVPKDVPTARKAAPAGENPFADLIPAPEGEQTPNIGAKGDKKPGSRFRPDIRTTFAHGALANFSDELKSAAGVPVQILKNIVAGEGPTSPGEVYEQNQAANKAEIEATRDAYPVLAPATEMAGALSTAVLPVGAAVRGTQALSKAPQLVRYIAGAKGLVPMAGRGAVAGGVYGGVAGAGEGDGVEDRLAKASEGAATGAEIGLIAPGVGKAVGQGVRLVKAVGRAATAPVRSLADKETFAAGKVAEALKRDSLSPERAGKVLRLKQQIKPETVLADVGGRNTERLMRAAANVPSEGRGKMVRELFQRQEGQLDRLRADVGSAFGDPKSFNSTVESLTTSRKQNAKPLFDAAFQTGTPWSVPLQNVLSRPLTRRLVGRAEEAAANRGEKFKAIFAQQQPNGRFTFARVPDTEALHRVKMEIDDAIRQVKNREETGLGNVTLRDLTILKKDLLNAIQNPLYKRALKQYAGDSAAVNAIDDGFENGLTMEPEAISKTLSGLSTTEADLWRLGLARKIVNQLRDSGGRQGTNRAEILYSPKYLDRMRAAFKDTKTGKDFMRKLHLERQMFKTRNAVEGNSTSAAQIAEGMEAGADAENIRSAADIGGKLVRGDMIGALVSWVGRAKNMATGLRPEVADQIIRMLTSKDPATVQRAQQLVQQEIAKLTRRQGTAGKVERGVMTAGFGAIPSLASSGGQ